ncbi:MAG TPA: hypothetical protein VK964_10520 [Nocardioidaceae bacterium]|nr:hypothetical protein [Nocardioidaceae bacterium]
MSRRNPSVKVRKLTEGEKREIERRERKHRARLSRLGYTTRALVDTTGRFGLVMVEDRELGRTGLLLPHGDVRWLDEAMGPGAFSDAVVSGIEIDGLP